MSCGCSNAPVCSCVITDGDGTTVSGAGTAANPYVVDGSSNIVLSDTVPVTNPPAEEYPGIALDPDTGLPVAYFVPGDGWHAVAGGAGGVEVYKGEGDPNTEIGDPGVSTAIYYDFGTPAANGAEVTDTYPYCIWIWNDADAEWQVYPNAVMASVSAAGSATVSSGSWTRLTSAPTERIDTAGMHSTSSNTGRIYAPYDGYYRISGRVRFAAVSGANAGTREIRLRLNNLSTLEFSHAYRAAGTENATSYPFMYGAVYLTAGDFVEVQAFQDSGSNMQVTLAEFTMKLEVPVAPPVGS